MEPVQVNEVSSTTKEGDSPTVLQNLEDNHSTEIQDIFRNEESSEDIDNIMSSELSSLRNISSTLNWIAFPEILYFHCVSIFSHF